MRFVVVKSSAIAMVMSVVVALSTLIGAVTGFGATGVYFGKTKKKIPIYCVQTEEKKIALSFDAAWGADKTEKLLETLNSYDVPATFFLVGFWVEAHPDMVKKIDNAGMEIGTHSNTHPHMSKLSGELMKSELTASSALIKEITGKEISLFRAPFGEYNDRLIETAASLNLFTIQWDVDTLDWKNLTALEMSERVQQKANPGSIVLMHNDGKYTPEALPVIIEALKNKGYSFCTVGDLIHKENYRIDNTGKQIKL